MLLAGETTASRHLKKKPRANKRTKITIDIIITVATAVKNFLENYTEIHDCQVLVETSTELQQ